SIPPTRSGGGWRAATLRAGWGKDPTRLLEFARSHPPMLRGEGSRPLRLCFRAQIHRAAHTDVIKVLGEKILRRLTPTLLQHLEEIEIRVELRSGGQRLERRVERDAVHIDAA